MSLPEAAPRRHVHTRAIDYRGYEREDGMWDIEAHMKDTKTYEFSNKWRGTVPIGEPMHEMLLRVTIDDSFVIRDIYAATEHSPFEMCPSIAPNYKNLIGIQMGPGWRKAIRMKVGGTQGCTHLTELLFPMATVAMQTIWPIRSLTSSWIHRTTRFTWMECLSISPSCLISWWQMQSSFPIPTNPLQYSAAPCVITP